MEKSDLVVLGSFKSASGSFAVKRSLKGQCAAEIQIRPLNFRIDREPSGEEFILLLKTSVDSSGQWWLSSPDMLSADQEVALQAVLEMRDDPASFLDVSKHPPSVDIVYTLGSLFDGFKEARSPVPDLSLARTGMEGWQMIPWGDNSVISLSGSVDAQGAAIVAVTDAPTQSKLAQYIRRCLELSANTMNGITEPYIVTVDARLPEKVRDLPRNQALVYLRARLSTRVEDGALVRETIRALGRMRDLESLDEIRVIALSASPAHDAAEEFIMAATRHTNEVQFP